MPSQAWLGVFEELQRGEHTTGGAVAGAGSVPALSPGGAEVIIPVRGG